MGCRSGRAMMQSTRFGVALGSCVVAALWAGCESSEETPDAPPADGAALTCTLDQPLTCTSVTICTNYTVMVFHAALPTPAGGEIRLGAYRLSYVVYPPGTGDDVTTEPADDEIAFGTSDFVRVSRDGSSAGLGSFTQSGSELSFSYSQSCASSTPPVTVFNDCGTIGPSSTPPANTRQAYTAGAQSISIFRDAPGGGPAMYVYTAVVNSDGTVGDACSSATTDPATPGDSQRCRAPDICVCEHHEDLALHCSSSSSN